MLRYILRCAIEENQSEEIAASSLLKMINAIELIVSEKMNFAKEVKQFFSFLAHDFSRSSIHSGLYYGFRNVMYLAL